MKNVLIISSSPRRGGNSDVLCDQFQKGAESAGHHVEKLFLKDFKIGYCTGCEFCNNNDRCAQHDDMAGILDRLVTADVIVFGSPIYFYAVCGQLKTFIDRCCPRYLEISDKTFYYILTAADESKTAIDKAVVELQGFMDCLKNPTVAGVIAGVGVWHKGEIEAMPAMQEAFEMGKGIG